MKVCLDLIIFVAHVGMDEKICIFGIVPYGSFSMFSEPKIYALFNTKLPSRRELSEFFSELVCSLNRDDTEQEFL